MPRTPWGRGTSKLMEPSEAKSSGAIELPSGLLPKLSFLAVSSLTAVRSGTRGQVGCPKPRGFGGCTPAPAAAAVASAGGTAVTCPPGDCPRPGAPARRYPTVGLRQRMTGFPVALGLSDATLRKSLAGPVVGGPPRPAPPPPRP